MTFDEWVDKSRWILFSDRDREMLLDCWSASRREALEEAAKVCDEQAAKVVIDHEDWYDGLKIGAKECAGAIRSLLAK